MSRSSGILSKDEVRTITDIRRDIWTASFTGIGYGSLAGITSHTIVSLVTKSKRLNRNTALLSFLGGGALGSFLAASTTGKNQVHNLHPIFKVGAKPKEVPVVVGSEYQQARAAAVAKRHPTEPTSSEDRRQNRILRRKTLQNALENQHGLNDSHGGRWVDSSSSTSTAAAAAGNKDQDRSWQ